MRINLQVYLFAGGLRAIANFLVKSEDPHIFAPVTAIVDTGSPTTVLGTNDLARMRISQVQLKKLESKKEQMACGGGLMETKTLPNTTFKFGENFECSMPIRIPVGDISEGIKPSILGVDFLINNSLKLIFNPIKKEAYFETQE